MIRFRCNIMRYGLELVNWANSNKIFGCVEISAIFLKVMHRNIEILLSNVILDKLCSIF